MAKKEDSNIFDEAKKQAGKKKKKKVTSSSEGKSVSKSQAKESTPTIASSPVGDMEVDDMLKRLRDMDQDLQKKMERVCELSGMTKREIEQYIENPHNFTDSQWQKMQKEKEKLEEDIYAAIGIRAKKRILKKKKKKIAKGRRGKTLGGRKGWMKM